MALLRPSIALKNGIEKLDGFLLAASLRRKVRFSSTGFRFACGRPRFHPPDVGGARQLLLRSSGSIYADK